MGAGGFKRLALGGIPQIERPAQFLAVNVVADNAAVGVEIALAQFLGHGERAVFVLAIAVKVIATARRYDAKTERRAQQRAAGGVTREAQATGKPRRRIKDNLIETSQRLEDSGHRTLPAAVVSLLIGKPKQARFLRQRCPVQLIRRQHKSCVQSAGEFVLYNR